MSEYYSTSKLPNIIWHHLLVVTLLLCQIQRINCALTVKRKSIVQGTLGKKKHSKY